MPSLTSIHDTNLLVWALQGLAKGIGAGDPLLDYLKKKIEARQVRWGLTEREAEHQRLSDMALQELDVLGLYDRSARSPTEAGLQLVRSLEADNSRAPIIGYFIPRLLTGFDDVDAFLQLMNKRGEVKIPRVPGKKELGLEVGHRGKRQSEVETPAALVAYLDATFDHIKHDLLDPSVFKERAAYWQLNSRGKRHYDIVRTIVRDTALVEFKYGDVKYKVVRDRMWYLGLVNWSEHLPEFNGEICYPLYATASFGLSQEHVRFESCIGPLLLAVPGRSHASFEAFIRALWSRFSELSRQTVGYVPIPDLRDASCRALKISDYAFNELFKRFARACSENKVPFSCNWETAELSEITQKRLTIDVPGIGIRTAVSIHKLA